LPDPYTALEGNLNLLSQVGELNGVHEPVVNLEPDFRVSIGVVLVTGEEETPFRVRELDI
jgi:hypothetical protein